MRIQRHQHPPPPATFTLAFSQHEGWAIVAALNDYAVKHPDAADKGEWFQWAKDLEHKLRL